MKSVLRNLVIERFRWIDGDADVPGLLRDGEILAAVGAGLAGLFDDEAFDLVVVTTDRLRLRSVVEVGEVCEE